MKRNSQKSRQTPERLRNAANDAIAFLRSMVKLVEARGWREVHFEFANCVLCTADTILASDPEFQDDRPRLNNSTNVSEMFEAFERVPVQVFKDLLMLLERELRKDVDELIERMSNTQRAA